MSSIFCPFTIKNLHLPNRFVLPAMQRGWGQNYAPSDKLCEYYKRCVEGGVGLIISESTVVDHPSGTGQDGFVLILDEERAPAWKRCIDAVHDAGGRMFVQLWHEGATRKQHASGPEPSYPTLSPSGLLREGNPNGRAATIEELRSIRDGYVKTAVLAKRLGADGVEIHAAHGYFLDQFLWHETNRRTDVYGGTSIETRARYPAEIVQAIREKVGEDFPISFRFSQWKEVDYTAKLMSSPGELESMLRLLRQSGVDIFHVSTRRFYQPEWPGSQLGLAGWTKSLTDAAVIAVGSVGLNLDVMDTVYTDEAISSDIERTLGLLNDRFNNGEFDLIAVGRSIMGDQQWVKKVFDGRHSDIVPFSRDLLKEALGDWDDATIRGAHRNSDELN